MVENIAPLVDSFGRVHTNLRISVTDRCNIRCFYCMPDESIQFKPRDELLTFEEIERVARIAATLGVNKLRLTGGEPLVRSDLEILIAALVKIPGIDDVALTTNGILLAEQAEKLKAAGLHRLNVSLDTLNEATFQRIARRKGIDRVLQGLFTATKAGFDNIRLNAIAIKSLTETEIIPLARFSRQHDFELRFIEFMPLDAEQAWQKDQVMSGERIREILETEFGKLLPAARPDKSQPAVDFHFADGVGRIGFINPVSQPFCGDCNRLRITAEGAIRNCLFSTAEWSLRDILRSGGSDNEIVERIRQSIASKQPGHGIDSEVFVRPERAMYQIGG